MICAKHQKPYEESCRACDQEARQKEDNLDESIARINKKAEKKGEAKVQQPLQWKSNPIYDGRRDYTQEFRAKLLHALQLIDNFRYGKMVDPAKALDVSRLFRLRRLDDVFQVAKTEAEWTGTVRALGGRHGEEVYAPDGTFKGKIMSYGCTTHARVSTKAGNTSRDDVLSMQAILDDAKIIYLHSKQVDTSTIVHELFHYFCHKDFYKVFGMPGVGAEWKTLNEGITEYFARMACTNRSGGAYPEEFQLVQELMGKTKFSEEQMASAYFGGKTAELENIVKTGEYKKDAVASATGMNKVLDLAGKGRQGRWKA